MKTNKLCSIIFAALALSALMAGCAKQDLGGGTEPEKLNPEAYPDFNPRSEVALKLNYDFPGYKALIEIYAENPMTSIEEGYEKKTGIEPFFKAYTDSNAAYNGKIVIPAGLTEVYLYTSAMGLPRCVKLEVADGMIDLDLSTSDPAIRTAVKTRGNGQTDYIEIDKAKKLYSNCDWGNQGKLTGQYLKHITHVTNGGEKISDLVQRLQWTLWDKNETKPHGLDNSKYLSGAEKTNVSVARKAADGTDITGATIDVVFLHEGAWFTNSLGYYYYDSSEKNPDVASLNKYIMIPNVSMKGHYPYDNGKDFNKGPLASGDKVQLMYYGMDGTGEPTEVFPPGVTIGWFIISDGYDMDNNEINSDNTYLYSNNNACITLYDTKTDRLIVGFEDGNSDKSYEDVLFYVEADPMKAIVDPENPGRPEIDEDDDIVTTPDQTETITGTLAFEDNWPWAGDYDLNDVVIEYKREILFDKDNTVKKITETYIPVHNGATFPDAFATMYDSDLGGTLTLPEGAVKEASTGAVVIFPNIKDAMGKEFVLVRDFGDGSIKKDMLPVWNPFIISHYVQGLQDRKEIHLPKHQPTELADKKLIATNEDAFYIYKDGKHPFALDLPVTGWLVPVEMTKIDDAYPRYSKWVNDGGNEDWYKDPDNGKVQKKQ